MSCPNFSKVNADHYYVINSVDEDGNSIDYDFEIESILSFLEDKGWSPDDSWNDVIDSRNIAEKRFYGITPYKTKTSIFDLCIDVQLTAISGRYSGINLDYDLVISTETGGDDWRLSEWDADMLVDSIMGSFKENLDYWGGTEGWNNGTWKLQKDYLHKWVINTLKKYCAVGEWACAVCCNDVLDVQGIFSNGGAVYNKMNGDEENALIKGFKQIIE